MRTQIIEKNGELLVEHTPCEYLKDKDLPVYYYIKDKVITVVSDRGTQHFFCQAEGEKARFTKLMNQLRNRDQYHQVSTIEAISVWLKAKETEKQYII